MKMDNNFDRLPDTVSLDDENSALVIIDQTELPGKTVMLSLKTTDEIYEAVKSLRVRGAPAIGVAAAIGYYLAAKETATEKRNELFDILDRKKALLASSRPTAVNLFFALDKMESCAKSELNNGLSVSELKIVLRHEAETILNDEIASSKAIGEYGLTLFSDGDRVLTHCNAGQLATVRYGTALAPIHLGRERGMQFKVYADETRPLLQGARLTAFELAADGIPVTVICDNMVSTVMRSGMVDKVIVGADRIAENGDVCNKIGTSGVAILAAYYKIPFYVAAPFSTIDAKTASGADIVIEERDKGEIAEMWYKKRMIPDSADAYNPAFDYTDHSLVSAIITEKGIFYPPYNF